MHLLCITDASKQFDVSSKTLRYYENVGILNSTRMEDNKYRYYDDEAIERIKQILILRKMQISIKDIIRIYENQDMSTIVEVFVNRINTIDEQVGALSELKIITNEFLQSMLKKGISKISALPLLYEEMDKQLNMLEEDKTLSFDNISAVSEKFVKPLEPAIISLPAMRVISSYLQENPQESDTENFYQWVQTQSILTDEPGQHKRFEFQNTTNDVIIQCIPNDFQNDSKYYDYIFEGGLFAAANIYLDEDLGERFRSFVSCFDNNKYYQIDYTNEGNLRHCAMLENLISPDNKRELVSLLVPVKKRMADPILYDKPKEVTDISISEIESANPILWEINIPLDEMTQSHPNNSYFYINENGEAEFIGYIIRAVLNTNISVKLPFRVDIEFRQSGDGKAGMVFYHSDETGYRTGDIGSRGFGINMGNDNEHWVQAIRFSQPIFYDRFDFPERGAINIDEWNHLTWIVGEKHLAVFINDEIRYCGTNFPYMSLDLSREAAYPIVIGSIGGNDKKYFRSIRVSQLVETQKNKLKKGELTMITKQSNNIIPVIHRLVTDEYGENYWFNGCARYVMECLGEKDYDYWFFTGLTGDIFTQHYTYTNYSGDALSSYMLDENPKQFVKDTFNKCGYAATYISKQEILENTEMYLNTLITYIDKGIPIIAWGEPFGVFVGYEEYGKVLLCIIGNNNQPERIPLEKALQGTHGWVFVGEKKESVPLAQIYRNAIISIPQHFNVKTDTYCFGAEAFRAWARDIENGKFDNMSVEEFDTWAYYTNYVCVLATNSGGCQGFLRKAQELNPDFTFLEDIGKQYIITGLLWNGNYDTNDAFAVEYVKSHSDVVTDNLETIGGGFNITLKALQDKQHREKIASTIYKFADCMDEILRILSDNVLY